MSGVRSKFENIQFKSASIEAATAHTEKAYTPAGLAAVYISRVTRITRIIG